MSLDTIPTLLAARASDCATLDAIVDREARLTYAELDEQSRARAEWLVSRGINKGHRVGLLMQNGCEWVVNACAIMRIGATLVPLSTLLRPAELTEQLSIAGVSHLVAVEQFRGRHFQHELAGIDTATLPSLRSIHWQAELGLGGDDNTRALTEALAQRVVPADPMVIIFSSGSSGTPKGVIHSHGNAIRANAAGLDARCIDRGDRVYLPMPLFWVGGFSGGLISTLNAGATLLTEAIALPKQTLAFLQAEQATLFRGWPDQAMQLAEHPDFSHTDLSSLKPGSLEALLPASRRSQSKLRANLFGMTETFGPFCGFRLDSDMPADKQNSCGQAFPGMQLRIVDPQSGDPLEHGKPGRIQVRGRNILVGICGREREQTFTADGWYFGGDCGWLDEDGFLYFSGREDDMIKFRGVSVYPSEIVKTIESFDAVERAFACAIETGDGPAIGAAIVPKSLDRFELASLVQATRQQLSTFKVPTHWVVLDSLESLPRTATGKVDKAGLQSLLREGIQPK